MSEATPLTTASAEVKAPQDHRWAARIGLVIVAAIVVSCFGLLIAAGHAGQ